jgi:hypothetical protein
MGYMAPIYGAIAAAEQKKREQEEEELMAEFIQQDKNGAWEYKIIRGTLGAFRGESRMRRALDKEAQASWELAMKLDDERMLLRRPRSASRHDATLEPGVLPYRTDYGGKTVPIVVSVFLLLLGVLAFAFISFSKGNLFVGDPSILMIIVFGFLFLLGMIVVAVKLRR